MSLFEAIDLASSGIEVPSKILESAFHSIMQGEASDAEVAGLLVALRTKGETSSEIMAAARACLENADLNQLPDERAIDTCGTGGDGAATFNISTISALVAAGAGATVVKHGNKAASSRSGSYDVLEALGVKVDLPVSFAAEIARNIGIGFFFARRAHPAMRYMANARQKLKIRTIMNCLGPILNPVRVKRQLLGVYDQALVMPIAQVLRGLGSERVMVVHGSDGLDELTTTGTSFAVFWDGVEMVDYTIDPEQYGIKLARPEDLRGGDPAMNAKIGTSILSGELGAPRDIVVLNSGAALWVAGLAENFEKGIEAAAKSIDSGAAKKKLEALIRHSQREA